MKEEQVTSKPKLNNSYAQKELDKAEKQFDEFNSQVQSLTQDRMNQAPKLETEQQTRISNREAQNSKDVYLKPKRTMASREKFNEKFRDQYNFKKEYVQFIAENKEIIGEAIELWTKPFPGLDAEFWVVPVNKPIWGPRYLAERIKECSYHRLRTENSTVTGSDYVGQFTGSIVVDNTIQRLDAIPVSERKSIFMGASSF